MKLLTKITITIFLLSFLSIKIKSKVILPEWDNNIIETNNSISFKTKSIDSYALDNVTTSVLYLGKISGNSYLFLNKTRINNPFPNDIKSLDSPLISFQNEYFFCSTKYFFKINSNNQVDKIQFPNFIDLSNYDYSIKLISCSQKSEIILVFINNTLFI